MIFKVCYVIVYIVDIPLLERLIVGAGCFQVPIEVSLKQLRILHELTVGDFSFPNCSKLGLYELSNLKVLKLLPFAFYRVREIEVKRRNDGNSKE